MTLRFRLCAISLLSCVMSVCLFGQQSNSPRTLVAEVVSSLGSAGLQGISISGNSESIAGSSDDTGAFSANCSLDGSSDIELQMSSNSRAEKRTEVNGIPKGTWQDENGDSHEIASHNLYTPASWFCPGMLLAQIVATGDSQIQFQGDEEKNGVKVVHFSVVMQNAMISQPFPLLRHLSQMEIYLDSLTLRPVFLDFNVHPDNDAGVDIPIEVQYSDYAQTNSVWAPFTVRRYINSSLALTLHIQSLSPSLANTAN